MRPQVDRESWLKSSAERFAALERDVEEARLGGAATPPDRWNALAHERRRLLASVASKLPSRGAAAEWFKTALEGTHGEPTQRFALEVAWHAGQVPRRYVESIVRWAIAQKRERVLERLANENGAVVVLDAMTAAVARGELGYERRRFYEYYVRARKDEDPARVVEARTRLHEASLDAPDAPPGARSARR